MAVHRTPSEPDIHPAPTSSNTRLIQGIFFQDPDEPIELVELGQNKRLLLRATVGQYMFCGSIWEDPDEPGVLTGCLQDAFGISILSQITITPELVRYRKRYEKRRDEILYTFDQRDGDSWVGTYSGAQTGRGITRCWLRDIPDDHLYADPLMQTLGSPEPHRWFG